MRIQFHTPKGIINVDTDTVSDEELVELKITREELNDLIPRDLTKELDDLKIKLKDKGVID